MKHTSKSSPEQDALSPQQEELLDEIAFFDALQMVLRTAEDQHYKNHPEEKPEIWPPPSWGPNWEPDSRVLKKLK
jgi:hypothetical protein